MFAQSYLDDRLIGSAHADCEADALDALAAGAAVTGVDWCGFTALHHTAQSCSARVAAIILDAPDPPVNTPSNDGETPLIVAMKAPGDTAGVVEVLLTDGRADIDAKTAWGMTPLIAGCKFGKLARVKALLPYLPLASVLHRDGDNMDARAWALRNGHKQVAKLIGTVRRQAHRWTRRRTAITLLSRAEGHSTGHGLGHVLASRSMSRVGHKGELAGETGRLVAMFF